MMSRTLLLSALVLTLAGCSGHDFSHAVGLSRDAPDEFAVTTRAPLSMPPNDYLPPPQPGAPRPQEPAARLAAEAALAPSIELNNRTGQLTPGQQALIAASGPTAPANIRTLVDRDAKRVNSNGGVVNSLKFWTKTPPPGQVIDPAKEAERLRELQAAQK